MENEERNTAKKETAHIIKDKEEYDLKIPE